MCGFQGTDADGDGYLDIACSESPGDDCDDAPPEDGAAVNPGAFRICNTTDDDCDGKLGWDDEMEILRPGTVLVEDGRSDPARGTVRSPQPPGPSGWCGPVGFRQFRDSLPVRRR